MLTDIWISTITRTADSVYRNPGTDDKLALIINNMQVTFGDTSQDDLEAGKANLYYTSLSGSFALSPGYSQVSDFNIDPVSDSISASIAITGSDAWQPRSIAVWASDHRDDGFLHYAPLALQPGIEGDIAQTLSVDQSEGNISMPLRLVPRTESLQAELPLRWLLIALLTLDGNNSPISLTLKTFRKQTVFSRRLPQRSDNDFASGKAYVYRLPAPFEFTMSDLIDGEIQLKLEEAGPWTPYSFFLFGIDSMDSNNMVPLVWIPVWAYEDLGTLSAPNATSVYLPIADPNL